MSFILAVLQQGLTWFSWGALGPHLSLCPWGASPSLWTHRPWLDSNLLGDSCNPWRSQRTRRTWKGKRKAIWHRGTTCFLALVSILFFSLVEIDLGVSWANCALQR